MEPLSAAKTRVSVRVARVSEKYFSHFTHPSSPPSLCRHHPCLTVNGGCQAFPYLLCTLYSRRAIPRSYVHFMHSSECRRLQRGVRATKERMVEGERGGAPQKTRKKRGRKGGLGEGYTPKRGVRGKRRRRMDGPVARLRRGNAMLSRGYI